MNTLATVDLIIITSYLGLVLLVGLYYSFRKNETADHYFLAGRSLGWVAIGMSIFATNISSEHFIGLAGNGASRGLAVGNFEWLAIFALILLGWYLAPILLKSEVFTVPEFFGKRFNKATQMYLSGISIVAYILTKISVSLLAGGLLLKAVLGWDLYTSAIFMVFITGIYTIIGGLKAVVYTSVIQSVFLIVGGFLLTFFGLDKVGGISGLYAQLPADFFSIFKPMHDPDFPWTGMIFGAPILAVWYWCTDQYIVQRIFSAKDVSAARRGALLTGFLKILPMFILVLPGLIAAALFPGVVGDAAYPTLLTGTLLPAGIKGLVLAGVLAALMSSLSACFITTSTLFTMDFYRHFKPDSSDKKLVLVGRLATTMVVLIGILWVPLVKLINSHIYVHLQSMQAYISPPIVAVFILGLMWKRINGTAAIWTLVTGGIIGAARLVLEWTAWPMADWPWIHGFIQMNFLHFALFLFAISSVVLVGISVVTVESYPARIRDYVISLGSPDFGYGDKTSTFVVNTNRLNLILSAMLIVVLLGLWGVFF